MSSITETELPLDEAVLFRAMSMGASTVTRTVSCACAGQITAVADYHWDIVEAVREHQRTDQHVAWRKREQL